MELKGDVQLQWRKQGNEWKKKRIHKKKWTGKWQKVEMEEVRMEIKYKKIKSVAPKGATPVN